METILELDYSLFEWINVGLENDLLDWVMPWWRSKYTWIPFYLVLIAYSFYRFKLNGLYLIMALAMTIGISDTISSKVIKPTTERLRPCKHEVTKDIVRLKIKCGSGFSFTSSHATNHFALAVFLLFTLGKRIRKINLPLLFWAGSIAFGQVYVGVHFPSDVIIGGIIGSLIGYFLALIFNRLVRLNENFDPILSKT